MPQWENHKTSCSSKTIWHTVISTNFQLTGHMDKQLGSIFHKISPPQKMGVIVNFGFWTKYANCLIWYTIQDGVILVKLSIHSLSDFSDQFFKNWGNFEFSNFLHKCKSIGNFHLSPKPCKRDHFSHSLSCTHCFCHFIVAVA